MTVQAAQIVRLCIAGVLAAFPFCTAPPACGVTPPAVDDSMLPKPAPAAPPRPTEQQERCVAAPPADAGTADPGQLKGMNLQAVWGLTRGAGQTVAVIDTGVARHRRLPHLVPGGDYVSTGDGASDCDGHGTMVAGIIGAEPDSADRPSPESRRMSRSSESGSPATSFGHRRPRRIRCRRCRDAGVGGAHRCGHRRDGDQHLLGRMPARPTPVWTTAPSVRRWPTPSTSRTSSWWPRRATSAVPASVRGQNPATAGSAGTTDWDGVSVVVSPAWYDDYVLTVGSVDARRRAIGVQPRRPVGGRRGAGRRRRVPRSGRRGSGRVAAPVRTPMPISGTSYAAPVVSGIAALVRSRSPELTARQVMQRIEDTAHRPAAGWDPLVGHGVVDALAAVSGDAPTPALEPRPSRSTSYPDAAPTDRGAHQFAVGGAAVCLAVSVATLAMTASGSRLRRSRDAVAND